MNKKKKQATTGEAIGNLAGAMGRGLLSGLAGTAAMTVVQMIEMNITGREGSTVPADAIEKVMPFKAPENKEEKMKLAQLVHFAYGTTWGIPLGVMQWVGITGTTACLTHFGAVWGAAQAMLPKLDLSPPITEWSNEQIASDVFHHAVYTSVASLTFHAIRPRS
ncbi:MAG: hypothetical protein WEB89_02970 [Balneolales bacterium]